MKKFLVFFLIAIIACKTVEEMQAEVIVNGIKEIYDKLKAMGVIDAILNVLKTAGKIAAEAACCTYAPEFCSVCGIIIGML